MDRKAFSSFLSMIVVLAMFGCGGGGSGSGGVTPGLPSQMGAIEGYAFRSASGAVVLAPGSSAPAGDTALSGASVSLTGASSGPSTTTDGVGHFLLNNAATGLAKLRVTPAGGAATDFPVTVLGAATVQVGDPTVTRLVAADKVKQAATKDLGTLDKLLIMGTQQPLPAGVTVAPAIPNPNGQDDPARIHQPARPEWLFFVDPESTALFGHAVRFYFVDAQTGAVTAQDQSSWPKINGLSYYGDPTVNSMSQDLVTAPAASRSIIARAAGSYTPTSRTRDTATPGTFALTVNALGFEGDERNIKTLYGHAGIPAATHSTDIVTIASKHPRADIVAAFDNLCLLAGPGDTIVFNIVGHGALDKRDPNAPVFADWLPTFASSDGKPDQGEWLFPTDLDFSKCNACHFVIIIGTCYSGNWIPVIQNQLQSKEGVEATVMTAADSSNEANGGPSLGPLSSYYYVEHVAKQPVDSGQSGLATAWTPAPDDPHHPQFWQRVPGPTEQCGLVKIKPKVATVKPADHVTISVIEPDPTKGTHTYHWNTRGNEGHLEDTVGHSGVDFDSSSSSVDYVANSTLSTGGSDMVTVEVFTYAGAPIPANKFSVGKATATISATQPVDAVTVNINAAVDGMGSYASNWPNLVPLGSRTYPLVSAIQSPSSSGVSIDSTFTDPAHFDSGFQWLGLVPSISPGVSVSAAPPGFSGSLYLFVPYDLNGQHAVQQFASTAGTITIKTVVGNRITFEASARMARYLGNAIPNSDQLGYVDVTVSGAMTLADGRASRSTSRPQHRLLEVRANNWTSSSLGGVSGSSSERAEQMGELAPDPAAAPTPFIPFRTVSAPAPRSMRRERGKSSG